MRGKTKSEFNFKIKEINESFLNYSYVSTVSICVVFDDIQVR